MQAGFDAASRSALRLLAQQFNLLGDAVETPLVA